MFSDVYNTVQGHREVAGLLQSPGDWMAGPAPAPASQGETVTTETRDTGAPRGDPEMVPVYVSALLPVFCHTFQVPDCIFTITFQQLDFVML